jgi:hydroxyacylglutathione hydrolase
MQVQTVSLRRDNYAYLLIDEPSAQVVVVDPSDAAPIIKTLESQQLGLTQIWCTHHHGDHVGGVQELVQRYQPAHVVASSFDLQQRRIPCQSHGLEERSGWRLGNHEVTVYDVPGHTLGAVAYLVNGMLFTGDVLFVAGCGYLFEGTPQQMWKSLSRLGGLEGSIRFYCGHEYTLANLAFAKSLEPQNNAIDAKIAEVTGLRAKGLPSVPSLLEQELEFNPFLRCEHPSVIAAAQRLSPELRGDDAAQVFQVIRQAKDQFRASIS